MGSELQPAPQGRGSLLARRCREPQVSDYGAILEWRGRKATSAGSAGPSPHKAAQAVLAARGLDTTDLSN